ncbi:hypothetical protein B6U90_00665 [Thermoplasmatales archaeon ex4484_6]|nr:MAG: hypothetical protein B6U90_00665 [Thermoplasmatales archaeon ex4484_6]
MDEEEVREIFLQETQENVEKLGSWIVELERDGGMREDLIDRIFRSFHTIKGMSASMGLESVSRMTHSMEELLSRIREGHLEPDANVTDILLGSIDRLERMISLMESGASPDIEVEDLIDKAKRFARFESDIEQRNPEEKGIKHPVRVDEEGGESRDTSDGDGISNWEIMIESDCQFPSIRMLQLISSINGAGMEIAGSRPGKKELDSLKPGERAILSIRGGDVEAVEAILGSIGEIKYRKASDLEHGTSLRSENMYKGMGGGPPQPGKRTRNEYVRIHVGKLDSLMKLVGELIIEEGNIREIAKRIEERELTDRLTALKRTINEIQEIVLSTRLMPLETHFSRFPRLVRDLSRELGKEVDLQIEGGDVELDRRILENLGDPLVHLLRNSLDHGIEPPEVRRSAGKSPRGRISLRAVKNRGQVKIEVSDDGRGIDTRSLIDRAVKKGLVTIERARNMDEASIEELIFQPGFSTADNVSEISGRGVGMDVVRSSVESMGGRVEIHSTMGKGTVVSLVLPLTLSIIGALIVSCSGTRFALPLNSIEKIVRLSRDKVFETEGRMMMMDMPNDVIPVHRLPELFDTKREETMPCDPEMGVIMESESGKICLLVERIFERRDIVVKPLGKSLRWRSGLAGSTIADDGSVVMIVDPSSIVGAVSGGADL